MYTFKIILACMWSYMYDYTYMWPYMYGCTCVHMFGSQWSTSEGVLQKTTPHLFESRFSLRLAACCFDLVYWPVSPFGRDLPLPTSSGIVKCASPYLTFCVVAGNKVRSSCLGSRHFTSWVMSPSPKICSFNEQNKVILDIVWHLILVHPLY